MLSTIIGVTNNGWYIHTNFYTQVLTLIIIFIMYQDGLQIPLEKCTVSSERHQQLLLILMKFVYVSWMSINCPCLPSWAHNLDSVIHGDFLNFIDDYLCISLKRYKKMYLVSENRTSCILTFWFHFSVETIIPHWENCVFG